MVNWPGSAKGRLTGVASVNDRLQRLDTLKDGGRFRYAILLAIPGHPTGRMQTVGWVYGTKLWHNASRCRVRLDGQQQQVTFSESDGQMRVFDASGASEMSYPTMLEVVEITGDGTTEGDHAPSDREQAMTDAQNQATGLQKRYEFQMGMLAKAEAAGDVDKATVAQQRIDAILKEAQAAGVVLGEGAAPAEAAADKVTSVTTKGKGKTTTKAAPGTKAVKEPKVPKEKKLPSTQNCLCGCGLETGGKFRPGHDAKVKGLLGKVEKGILKFADLPPLVQAVAKFAGTAATAGKEGSNYRCVQSPVKFPGRDDITIV